MTVTNWTAALLPDLTGKTFIVTGATSGLGKATADR
jgi:short-subunit dehydrogenase